MKDQFIYELKNTLKEDQISDSIVDCEAYALVCNGVDFDIQRPDVVVLPETLEDVVQIVKLASTYKVPLLPRGKGTSVLGCNVPLQGGMLVDLSKMNEIIKIDKEHMVAIVEAGCVSNYLFNALDKENLMFGIRPWFDPQMQIGAWVACNGNGDFSNQFGTVGQNVIGLEVVLANGRVTKVGSWTNEDGYGAWMRYPGGPDLVGLFTGSIGTLGIITKVALRIIEKPKFVGYSAFGWPQERTEDMAQAVHKFLRTNNVSNLSLHNYWALRGAIKMGLIELPRGVYFIVDVMTFASKKEELEVKQSEILEIGSGCGTYLGEKTCKMLHGPPNYVINAGNFKQIRSFPKRVSRGVAWAQFYFYTPVLKFPECWEFFETKVKEYGFCDRDQGPCLYGWAIPPEALAPFPAFPYRTGEEGQAKRVREAWSEMMGGLLEMGCLPYSLGSFLPREQATKILGSSYELLMNIKQLLDPDNVFNPSQI
jgi:FAD/FMN-containing dehydrogenase